MEVSRLGVKSELLAYASAIARQIQATSAINTAFLGNAGFLAHRVRPGLEPTSSWILVRFVSAAPQWELLFFFLFFFQTLQAQKKSYVTLIFSILINTTGHSLVRMHSR